MVPRVTWCSWMGMEVRGGGDLQKRLWSLGIRRGARCKLEQEAEEVHHGTIDDQPLGFPLINNSGSGQASPVWMTLSHPW